MNALRTAVLSVIALAILAVLFACALASEAWGRLRHGRDYESGGGLGCEEDYAP